METDIIDAADGRQRHGAWWKRIGWLLLIWLLSVGALGLVASVIKMIMSVAGLTG